MVQIEYDLVYACCKIVRLLIYGLWRPASKFVS